MSNISSLQETPKTPVLWMAVSHHGFGHLGQVATIVKPLFKCVPDLRLIIQSGHPLSVLQRFLPIPFEYVPLAADRALIMLDSMQIDFEHSCAEFIEYHQQAEDEIETLCRLMHEKSVTLVLSNVGYFPLAAAKRLSLPAVALCSLNWADILRGYVHVQPVFKDIAAQMAHWYAMADVFITLEPSMPMPSIPNTFPVGPIARRGKVHSLANLLSFPEHTKFGVISLGGIPHAIDYSTWPITEGWVWCVKGEVKAGSENILSIDSIPLEYVDLVASANLMITKAGYGNFVEAGCAGIPVACLPRPDWPEAPALFAWLEKTVPVIYIDEHDLQTGTCLTHCAHWVENVMKKTLPTEPAGVATTVNYLVRLLENKPPS